MMLKSSLPLSTISVNSAQRPEVIDREAQVLDLVKKIVATAPQTKPEPFNQRVSKEERQTGVLKTKPLKVKGGMARTIFVIGAKQVVALLGGFVPGPDSTRESQWWNTCVRSSELDSILHAKYVHEEEHEGLYHFLVPAKDAPDLVVHVLDLEVLGNLHLVESYFVKLHTPSSDNGAFLNWATPMLDNIILFLDTGITNVKGEFILSGEPISFERSQAFMFVLMVSSACPTYKIAGKIETILQKLAITRSYDKVFVASKYLGNDTLLTNEVIGKILKTLNFDKSFVHAAIAQLQETVEMQGGTVTKLQEAVEMQGETVAQLQAAVEMQGEQVDELNEKVEEQGEKLLAVETLKEQVADLAKARDKTTAELRAELDTVIFAQSELEIKFTDQVVEVDEKLVEAEINFKRYVARFVFGLVVPILLIVFGTQNIFQKDVKTRQDNLEADVVALREDIKSENAKRKSEHAEFKAEIYLLIGELKMRTIRATNYLARSMSYLLGWTAGLQTEVDKQAESNKKMGDRITGVAESTRKKMLVMHAEFDASKAIAKA